MLRMNSSSKAEIKNSSKLRMFVVGDKRLWGKKKKERKERKERKIFFVVVSLAFAFLQKQIKEGTGLMQKHTSNNCANCTNVLLIPNKIFDAFKLSS